MNEPMKTINIKELCENLYVLSTYTPSGDTDTPVGSIDTKVTMSAALRLCRLFLGVQVRSIKQIDDVLYGYCGRCNSSVTNAFKHCPECAQKLSFKIDVQKKMIEG